MKRRLLSFIICSKLNGSLKLPNVMITGRRLPDRRIGAARRDRGLLARRLGGASEVAAGTPPDRLWHPGGGNIGLKRGSAGWSDEQRQTLFRHAEELILHEFAFGGSITAEHGIGRSKKRASRGRGSGPSTGAGP